MLTEQEIKDAVGFTTDQMTAYRRVESAVLEKLNPRIAELEAVLRECREAFVKNIAGSSGRTQAMHEAILKIDEVLNEDR